MGNRNKAHTIINASFNKFQDNSNNAALVTFCVCLVVIKFELCLANRHLLKSFYGIKWQQQQAVKCDEWNRLKG